MTKQDWTRKLTSRKFWVAIAGFVAGLVAFFKSPSGTPEAITSLIMSFGAVVAYIVGEGMADAAGANAPIIVEQQKEPPDDNAED